MRPLPLFDHKQGRFQWYEKDDVEKTKEWCIVLSIQTIAECLNILTDADSLTHLYDRTIDAANVLQNISITVTDPHRRKCTIDGYVDLVGIQEHCDIDDCIMKSNAIFFFFINPQLIDHLDSQRVGLYHFNHALQSVQPVQHATANSNRTPFFSFSLTRNSLTILTPSEWDCIISIMHGFILRETVKMLMQRRNDLADFTARIRITAKSRNTQVFQWQSVL